jgi:hypothetical protein
MGSGRPETFPSIIFSQCKPNDDLLDTAMKRV